MIDKCVYRWMNGGLNDECLFAKWRRPQKSVINTGKLPIGRLCTVNTSNQYKYDMADRRLSVVDRKVGHGKVASHLSANFSLT